VQEKPYVGMCDKLYQVQYIVKFLKARGYAKEQMYLMMRSEKRQESISLKTGMAPLDTEKDIWEELTTFFATREAEMADHLMKIGVPEEEAGRYVGELATDDRKMLVIAKTSEEDWTGVSEYLKNMSV
jgi:hypothetical protein